MNEAPPPLDAIRVFIAVAETQGFSAAARRLNLSQATASRQIARLEEALGAQLLRRSTRSISLTEAGRLYLDRARAVLAELDEATQAVRTLSGEPRGLLRVAAPTTLGQRVIAPQLQRFHEAYPDLAIGLFLSDRRDDLIAGGYDMAIRFGLQDDSDLVSRRIATSRSCICASPAYLERCGEPESPEDLTRRNCLLFRQSAGANVWHFSRDGAVRSAEVSGSLFSDTADALLAAATAGLGVVHLPTWLIDEAVRTGALRIVLTDWTVLPEETPVFAVYPERRRLSAKVSSFVEFLQELFRRKMA